MNPNTPGKYDDICTLARLSAEAQGAMLIVVGGNRGSGFSVQLQSDLMQKLPGVLREVADQVEQEFGPEKPTSNEG